jgi:hypothetical protein
MNQTPVFSEEETNRLLFYRHLVEKGKLTEFPGSRHQRVVKHLARARKQPHYHVIVLAPAERGGFSSPSPSQG